MMKNKHLPSPGLLPEGFLLQSLSEKEHSSWHVFGLKKLFHRNILNWAWIMCKFAFWHSVIRVLYTIPPKHCQQNFLLSFKAPMSFHFLRELFLLTNRYLVPPFKCSPKQWQDSLLRPTVSICNNTVIINALMHY